MPDVISHNVQVVDLVHADHGVAVRAWRSLRARHKDSLKVAGGRAR
jgi:hypothetical protein